MILNQFTRDAFLFRRINRVWFNPPAHERWSRQVLLHLYGEHQLGVLHRGIVD